MNRQDARDAKTEAQEKGVTADGAEVIRRSEPRMNTDGH
jgi:hypothetical protein